MNNQICDMLGIEFPLLAFSHCRDVVAAVSKAGGFGVFGAVAHTPETIHEELDWIDAHCGGKPYGVDVLVPENLATAGETQTSSMALSKKIPQAHRDFSEGLLNSAGITADKFAAEAESYNQSDHQPFDPDNALRTLEAAFEHPIKLIANALGVPPKEMIDMGKKHGVPVAALVGAKEHALRQVEAGVDIIVAQGTEGGGHCGQVSTMVLIAEVLKAIRPHSDAPVLAAGGIMTGQQMAGCMAMGAAGAWTGSVWLATNESETSDIFREKMIDATSRDAVRVNTRTGKPARQLRSGWTEAWDKSPDSPGALPMPYMSLISEPALKAVDKAALGGNQDARDMVTYFVGQGVGLVDGVRGAGQVVQDFKAEYLEAIETLNSTLEG